MAYRNSLFLIAFFLVTTSSVANCQIIRPILATVRGVVSCNAGFVTVPLSPNIMLNAQLVCGLTSVAPAVRVNLLGIFLISVRLPNATLVNPANCTVVVDNVPTAIGGCPVLNSGQVLQAPIINLLGAGGSPRTIELFRAGLFRAVNRTSVAINATISA